MAQQNSTQIAPGTSQAPALAPKVGVAQVPAKPEAAAVAKPAKGASVEKAAEKPPAPPRSIAQIEADMDATRERLANTIGQLKVAVSPKTLIRQKLAKVQGFYVDEYGAIRPDRVAMTAGVVVGGVVVIRVTKRIFS